MIEVRVDTMTVDKGSLHIGCVVSGPEGAWMKFAVCSVPLNTLDWSLICAIVEAWDREAPAASEDQPLF